ncbi:MAG: hypothetical protein AAGI11_08050 [Pseudomonadota bacterium]
MPQTYHYHYQSRRPLVLAALAVIIVLLAIAFVEGAPWYIWLIWGSTGLLLVFGYVVNRQSGLTLTTESFNVRVGKTVETVNLKDIQHVEFQEWSDSTDVSLHLLDGRTQKVPSLALPPIPVLEQELHSRGVKTVRC